MELRKIFWHINLLLKKPFFKHVGKYSYLGPTVSLVGMKNISIGNKVRIYPGCRMETHNGGEIVICDDCFIAQNFHCTSGGGTRLIIGEHTVIVGNVCITNIDHEYRNIGIPVSKQPFLVSETIIGENCFIGYGAMIQAGTKLGKQCIIGAHAVVRGEFPDYSVIVGAPARIVRQYDIESEKWRRVYDEYK